MAIKRLSGIEFRRVSIFGLVGILNTLLDFVIYNQLSSSVGLGLVQSNIISTTVAMIFSFIANKRVVFKKHNGSTLKQGLVFFAVTAFGLYVLQTGTIMFLTNIWFYPLHLGLVLAHAVGLKDHDDFLIKNGAKAVATAISLIWNYVMYKRVVFR